MHRTPAPVTAESSETSALVAPGWVSTSGQAFDFVEDAFAVPRALARVVLVDAVGVRRRRLGPREVDRERRSRLAGAVARGGDVGRRRRERVRGSRRLRRQERRAAGLGRRTRGGRDACRCGRLIDGCTRTSGEEGYEDPDDKRRRVRHPHPPGTPGAGRSRQWLGAVPAARAWAARHSFPSTHHGTATSRPRREANGPPRSTHRAGLCRAGATWASARLGYVGSGAPGRKWRSRTTRGTRVVCSRVTGDPLSLPGDEV